MFTSSLYPVVSSRGATSIPHGLGIAPSSVRVVLVSQSSPDFASGDEIDIREAYCPTFVMPFVFGVVVDSVNVTISSDGYDVFSLIPKAGGQRIQQDPANWRIKVYAVG